MSEAVLYRVAANLVLLLHLAYVGFVVFGLVAIWVGHARRWGWVRRPGWRYAHLGAIGIVVAQAWAGLTCPLTTWENALRRRAGQSRYEQACIEHWLRDLLFIEAPPWAFVVGYTAFGLLVLGSLIWVAPRRSS